MAQNSAREAVIAKVMAINTTLGKILLFSIPETPVNGRDAYDEGYIRGFTRVLYDLGHITQEERDLLIGACIVDAEEE